ncbi:MAG: hypothetical protein ABIH49_01545 [archaeon]
MILLQSFGLLGGGLGNVLAQWEQLGVFTYVLPFLLMFAIIFGVLSKVNVFGDNKAINAVIAVSVSLMALQFNFVSTFFATIFPRLGMWLSVVLIILILVGLFNKEGKWPGVLMVIISLIIVVIILVQTFGTDFAYPSFWWQQYGGTFVIIVFILVAVMWVWSSSKPSSKTKIKDFVDKVFDPWD